MTLRKRETNTELKFNSIELLHKLVIINLVNFSSKIPNNELRLTIFIKV